MEPHQQGVIRFKTSDGKIIEADKYEFRRSPTITLALENAGGNPNFIPLEDISSTTLQYIILWLNHHKDTVFVPRDEEQPAENNRRLPDFDNELFRSMGNEELSNMLTAACVLSIQCLLEAGCKYVAEMTRGKGPEELRQLFGISDDEDVE